MFRDKAAAVGPVFEEIIVEHGEFLSFVSRRSNSTISALQAKAASMEGMVFSR
jgi:hypothetical protein